MPASLGVSGDYLIVFILGIIVMAKKVGDDVSWNWGNGSAKGTIKQFYKERVTKTIKGTKVVRDADGDNPAYLIEQDDGNLVLKSDSEIN